MINMRVLVGLRGLESLSGLLGYFAVVHPVLTDELPDILLGA